MKRLLLFVSLLIAVAAFVYIQKARIRPNESDEDELLESVVGDKDDPGAAFRFRHDMLAGSHPDADLQLLRRQAVDYTNHMASAARGTNLRKTTADSWTALGPGNVGGRVRSIVVNPSNGNQIIIGSVSGGIWKSTDGGASWSSKTDTLSFLAISSLLIDPLNSNVVYAGTGEGWQNYDAVYGGGIYKSTDFGDTWALLSSTTGAAAGNFRNVMKLASDTSGNIYAATKDYMAKYGGGVYDVAGGLFLSSNQGTSWNKISSTTMSTNYFNPDDVVAVSSSVIDFAVGANGATPGGIYRTTDGGGTWSKVSSALPASGYGRIALAQDPNTLTTLYAAFESLDTSPSGDGGLKGIFKSTDGGAVWIQLTSPQKIASTSTSSGNMSYLKDQGWYDNVIAVDPNNSSNIFVGGVEVMKTTNGGASWTQATYWNSFYGLPYVHADHHAIAFDRTTPNTIIEGNDGGVYKTTNAGASWTSLNNGLSITQFYGGAVYKTGATYYGGTQDNGHLKYSGTGTLWSAAVGGDGGYAAQDQTTPQVSYEEYVYLELSKTTDGGTTWNDCISGLTDAKNSSACLFIAPFAMSTENSSDLIAGSNRVWVSTNSAGSWTAVSNVLSSGRFVSAVTLTSGTTNFLAFAGTTDGKMFRCRTLDPTAGVNAWDTVTPPSSNNGWVRRIVVDPNDKNKVYACYGGYNTAGQLSSRHLWYSTDQGTTWSDISTQLPNVPVHSLAIDPNSSSVVYAGTETGVYTTSNLGTTWQLYSAGMPTYVPTDEVVVQHDTKALFAFTHGRGVFSTSPSSNSSPGWTIQTSGITASLASVRAVDQSTCWTAGAGGVVLLTTNGGNKWNSVGGGTIGTSDIWAVDALDANTAFVTTSTTATMIYRTTNGGGAWSNVYSLTGGFIDGIKMLDASNGIAVGDPVGGKWTVLKTTDGGASWARIATEPAQSGTEAGWNNSVAVAGSSNIWFGTNSYRIYRSTDAGATWSWSPIPFANSLSVAFSDAQYGVAGSDSGATARTTDGGASWVPVSAGNGAPVFAISATPSDFFAVYGGSVYRSGTHGGSWTASFTGSIGTLNALNIVSTGSNIFGWAASSAGNIAGFSGTASAVDAKTGPIPSQFVLQQNYPNPFNPQTTIEFDLPKAVRVSLKIFNAAGAEVATLVDNVMSAGVHDVVWNGRNGSGAVAASGVYFYRVAAGEFAATKKMLLIK